jgi:NACalpha-BTF3-like transcription factor
MKRFLFGERNGVHIVDLDQTLPRLQKALDFLRETVASGGKVLFVSTKRQAQAFVEAEAQRCEQYYVSRRWLGGMLTNFKTVRKSIEHFKELLELVGDAEKVAEISKKELSGINRSIEKYKKSLDGIKEMTRLPDAAVHHRRRPRADRREGGEPARHPDRRDRRLELRSRSRSTSWCRATTTRRARSSSTVSASPTHAPRARGSPTSGSRARCPSRSARAGRARSARRSAPAASWSRSSSSRAAGAGPTARRRASGNSAASRPRPRRRRPRPRASRRANSSEGLEIEVAEISAKDVMTLREQTGAGMMDCKRALADAGGDAKKATDLLRERGLAKAGKREGRATSEGAIAIALDGRTGAMIEIGCETDFVARTDAFTALGDSSRARSRRTRRSPRSTRCSHADRRREGRRTAWPTRSPCSARTWW